MAEKKTPQEQGRSNAVQGAWGEAVTAAFLCAKGWRELGRNVRPCTKDLRCEIDLIMKDPENRVVFVEVKTHARHSSREGRLARITREKKRILLRACANWVMRHHWHGNFRFDVVQVYGSYDGAVLPEIDHIENVPLFPPNWRFW